MRLAVICLFLLSIYSVHAQPEFTLFLLGDAGEPGVRNVGYKNLLRQQLQIGSSSKAALFLGDNIYPNGMPPVGSSTRKRSEDIISTQINLIATGCPVYFLPGNHD